MADGGGGNSGRGKRLVISRNTGMSIMGCPKVKSAHYRRGLCDGGGANLLARIDDDTLERDPMAGFSGKSDVESTTSANAEQGADHEERKETYVRNAGGEEDVPHQGWEGE